MKNYKIIETRPELNAAQIAQGMDFSKIKSKAALASKTTAITWSVKTIILNSVAGAVLVGGTLVGIKMMNRKPVQENKTYAQELKKPGIKEMIVAGNQDSIRGSNEMIVNRPVEEKAIITPTKSPVRSVSVQSTVATETVPLSASATETVGHSNAVSNNCLVTQSSAAYTPVSMSYSSSVSNTPTQPENTKEEKMKTSTNVRCTILTENITASYPDSLNFPYGMECVLACELKYISASEIKEVRGIRTVLFHVKLPQKKLLLMTNFSNITLSRKGVIKHPVAVGIGDIDGKIKKPKYIHRNFRSKGALLKVKKTVDILLFFDDPQEGDKLIFEGYHAILFEQ